MQQILENCRISHYKALDIFAHFCNNMRWVMIKKNNVTSTCECVLEEVSVWHKAFFTRATQPLVLIRLQLSKFKSIGDGIKFCYKQGYPSFVNIHVFAILLEALVSELINFQFTTIVMSFLHLFDFWLSKYFFSKKTLLRIS